ncbi:MAG: hypothetical protein ACRDHX_03210 [Chloroflexota bacterium]
MVEHARESIDNFGQLGNPLGAGARGRAALSEPVTHGTRRRSDSSADLSVREMSNFADAQSFQGGFPPVARPRRRC